MRRRGPPRGPPALARPRLPPARDGRRDVPGRAPRSRSLRLRQSTKLRFHRRRLPAALRAAALAPGAGPRSRHPALRHGARGRAEAALPRARPDRHRSALAPRAPACGRGEARPRRERLRLPRAGRRPFTARSPRLARGAATRAPRHAASTPCAPDGRPRSRGFRPRRSGRLGASATGFTPCEPDAQRPSPRGLPLPTLRAASTLAAGLATRASRDGQHPRRERFHSRPSGRPAPSPTRLSTRPSSGRPAPSPPRLPLALPGRPAPSPRGFHSRFFGTRQRPLREASHPRFSRRPAPSPRGAARARTAAPSPRGLHSRFSGRPAPSPRGFHSFAPGRSPSSARVVSLPALGTLTAVRLRRPCANGRTAPTRLPPSFFSRPAAEAP